MPIREIEPCVSYLLKMTYSRNTGYRYYAQKDGERMVRISAKVAGDFGLRWENEN